MATKPRGLRRLFLDIETSPNIVYAWRCGYRLNIDYSNIRQERAVVCIAYKWQGDKTETVLSWNRNGCDAAMLKQFAREIISADECIGHNIKRFDLPWIRTRALLHGVTVPQVKIVDTLQWARRHFYFNSNRLDYLADYFGIGRKIKTEFGLWKQVVEGDRNALAEMKRYCGHDVHLLERVYDRLALVCPVHTHAGVVAGRDKWSCAKCGSENVRPYQRNVTASGQRQMKMHCRDCGGFPRISDTAYRAYAEARETRPDSKARAATRPG